MKAVMISVKPKMCEKVASGDCTILVRKTRPKIDTPFKCYIYCSQGDALAPPCLNNPNYTIHRTNNGTLNGRKMTAEERKQSDHLYANGKVIGEFVCDRIVDGKAGVQEWEYICENSNLSCKEIYDYCGEDEEGETKYCYGWHISDLVIYDKPRDVGEFYVEGDCDCLQCKKCYWFDKGNGYNVEDDCALAYKELELHRSLKPIISPPKSWCYVEEKG